MDPPLNIPIIIIIIIFNFIIKFINHIIIIITIDYDNIPKMIILQFFLYHILHVHDIIELVHCLFACLFLIFFDCLSIPYLFIITIFQFFITSSTKCNLFFLFTTFYFILSTIFYFFLSTILSIMCF